MNLSIFLFIILTKLHLFLTHTQRKLYFYIHSVLVQKKQVGFLLPSLLAHGCKKTSDCGPNNRPELVFSDKKHGWFLVPPLLSLVPNLCEPLLSLMF